VSEDELDEWWALEQIHPLPDPWLQTGLLCAYIGNYSMNKPRKWLTPGDVLPFLNGEKRRQSNAEIRARLSLLVAK
jgi:hypothetical protein